MLAAVAALPGPAAAETPGANCAPAPAPVQALAYGSRYADGSENRTRLDADADAEVDAALKPVDDFLRDLADRANGVHAPGADPPAIAACVLARLAPWARADALAELDTTAARLTAGSRLAAFALILRQVVPHAGAGDGDKVGLVSDWLARRVVAQMRFWEQDAPEGARQGNLRAWAALAAAATADLTDDAIMRGWAAWSTAHVLCTANPDGSLPQEMTRGRWALHYQLHAVAPLAVSAALLEPRGFPVAGRCGAALARVVRYTVSELDDGRLTQARTGEVQTFFDGTRQLEGFNLAWLEAYLTLDPDPALEALASVWRPLSHSKLGGDQTAIWAAERDR
ncbi:alginate lyase family protein [Halovulum marinum]|uniref:alginate lyase family protein n=1 Tax=Halovulum marinum TaxID=2662447 RepID=UPI002D779161|nr:alginate lyase family protein [Halovulum marinum]